MLIQIYKYFFKSNRAKVSEFTTDGISSERRRKSTHKQLTKMRYKKTHWITKVSGDKTPWCDFLGIFKQSWTLRKKRLSYVSTHINIPFGQNDFTFQESVHTVCLRLPRVWIFLCCCREMGGGLGSLRCTSAFFWRWKNASHIQTTGFVWEYPG